MCSPTPFEDFGLQQHGHLVDQVIGTGLKYLLTSQRNKSYDKLDVDNCTLKWYNITAEIHTAVNTSGLNQDRWSPVLKSYL